MTLSTPKFGGVVLPIEILTKTLEKGEDGSLALFEPQWEGENYQFFNTLVDGGRPSVELVDPTPLISIHPSV